VHSSRANESSPFAFEEPIHWMISPSPQQQLHDKNQETTSPEEPKIFIISPAQRQQPQVNDNQNQVSASLPFTLAEPTIFFINPALQKQVGGNQHGASKATSTTPSPTPSVPQQPGPEKESNDNFVATLRLPEGVTADDLKVRIRNKNLSVTGKKSEVTADSVALTTSFSRQWTLDEDIDTDNVTAVIEQDGLLVITAPKKAKVKEVIVAHVKESSVGKENQKQPQPVKTAAVAPKKDEAVAAKKKDNNHRSPSPPSPAKKKVVFAQAKDLANNHDVTFDLRITQNDNANLVVTVPVPDGVFPNDVSIEVKDKVLNISGVLRKETEDGSAVTTKLERHLVLDERVETEKISATFDAEKRVLTVAAPKKPPLVKPPQKIAINITSPKEEKPIIHRDDSEPKAANTEPSSNTAKVSSVPPAVDEPNNHVKIAVQEQESAEGTKIIVETVAEE
jgi:HSP20 family molecular chaperone IbpA